MTVGPPFSFPDRILPVPRILPLLAVAGATALTALLTATATAATTQTATAVAILRLGPANGRVVVKIRCDASTAQRAVPLTGQYTLTTTDGSKVADGGFSCAAPGDQYAYATVVGSADEEVPGTGTVSKAVAKANQLVVQMREIDAAGKYVRLGAAKTVKIGGWLLNTDVAGIAPGQAKSTGASATNHAPTLFLSAKPTTLERCAWKVTPIGGPGSDVTSDADGDPLTITWYADGKKLQTQPLTTGGGAHLAVLRHTFAKLGVHHVKVVVKDTKGASTSQTAKLSCYSSKK
jgi:hypothetical protein